MSLGQKALALGKMLVQGFHDGIMALATLPVEAIKKMGGGAIDALKGVLQSKSPSKVTMGIGEDTSEGTALGIERRMERVRAAAARMGQAALPAIAGGSTRPQVVTREERIARSVSETVQESRGELLIRDETGRAEVRKPMTGKIGLRMQPSGAF